MNTKEAFLEYMKRKVADLNDAEFSIFRINAQAFTDNCIESIKTPIKISHDNVVKFADNTRQAKLHKRINELDKGGSTYEKYLF